MRATNVWYQTGIMVLLGALAPQAVGQTATRPPLPESQASAPADAKRAPMVHALLIGVSDYGGTGLASLMGPENDVMLMREVLSTRFAVPPANIRLLVNPTHTAIEQEFVALHKRVRRRDIVYIHYSGHGSTAPDPGDARGEDQTWVAFGARSHKRKGVDDWDVLDKELAAWIKPLYELSDDIVFVSDSCHSGTVSRGVSMGVRSGAAVGRPHPLLGKLPATAPPATGIRIGAARDFETAVELDQRNGNGCDDRANCYGVFTWNWAQALRESRPGEAWGDVFKRANARITTSPSIYQRPQLEGRSDRAVFGGRYAPLTSSVEVLDVDADGKATLNAGQLAGVSAGSTYRSLADSGADPASLRVTSVEPLTSVAMVERGKVKRADLVTESVHAYAAEKIRIFIGTAPVPSDTDAVKRLGQALTREMNGTLSAFEIEPVAERADWRLHLVRPNPATGRAPTGGAARRLPDDRTCAEPCVAPELWVVSRQGLLMDERMRFDLNRGDAEFSRLVHDLRAFAWSREVRRLAAQGNATPVRMTVTLYRPPPGDTRKCAIGAEPGSGWSSFGPYPIDAVSTQPVLGDCLSVELQNQDRERTWYGYVIAIGPNLAVQPFLPEPGAGSDAARVPPNGRLRASDRFYRFSETGQETLLLMVSDAPVRVQALQQAGLRNAPKSQLEALLSSAAARRGNVEAVGSWGAAGLDFWIATR
jgi:hypothetical protein